MTCFRNCNSLRNIVQLNKMKIAIIGQSQFAAEVYQLLRKNKHEIVGVFTIPDVQGRSDPLAQAAEKDGVKVFKNRLWRKQGVSIPEVVNEYLSVGAELNVMPFCSQFIPMDVITAPKYQSIIYHPSILPLHRGASAINWTLMQGDSMAGFTIFWADEGLDTGPILLQKQCVVLPNDTVDSLYNRFLYPAGIKAMAEAVQLIVDGKAPRLIQQEEGATYDAMLKKDKVEIPFAHLSARQLHNFIRGNDKVPGAWGRLKLKADDLMKEVTFYGSRMWHGPIKSGKSILHEVIVEGSSLCAIVHKGGLLLPGNDGAYVNVSQLQFNDTGRMISASMLGVGESSSPVGLSDLTAEEIAIHPILVNIWSGILAREVNDETDFFKSGGGSMDVTRLIEAVKQCCGGVSLSAEDVYMATTLKEFFAALVLKNRGGGGAGQELCYDAVELTANDMSLRFPNQLFINNEFVDAVDGRVYDTINPADESVICQVAFGGVEDVDKAVAAAKLAFEEGEWGKMSARDRGKCIYRLADLMEQCKEELATLESLDSGAVYTLALKTHIGMSIDTFRYFAGWCDKIQGDTIPISQARPNHNLTFTRREPIGVCGIVTPWNYPLMMLAWKMAACLAAGNTVVLKPAQVTPLTSLKFCELVVRAGFPKGVVNVLAGSGKYVGQAIAEHPDIRKLGFTGSTPVGKTIMESCARSNLKKVSLELGGKSPLIIFKDCDLEKAVRVACNGVFFNKGENCIAAGRLFVEASIHDEFVDRVVMEIRKMKIGNPLDRTTDHGPQNHRAHLEKLLEYVSLGVEQGAKLIYGGRQCKRPGLFMEPTVFCDVADDNYIAIEESFGPIMIISKFDDDDFEGVIRRANNTEFGLASGVFTKDMSKALRVADRIQAGTVFVNTYNKTDVAAPFGGFKQSGFGKDLGKEALNEYLKTKAVTIEY